MLLTSLKWKFDADAIRATPRTQGVFGLWDRQELVFIGATERDLSLPEALQRLLKLKRRGGLQATHFTWEITITPRSWSAELLRLYFNQRGMLPRHNRATSRLRHEIQANLHMA